MWSQQLKEQCFKVNSMLRKLTAPQKPSFLPCNDLQELKNNNNNNQRTILWKSLLISNKPTNLNMNTLCRYCPITIIIMITLSHMLGTFTLGGKWTIPYKGVCKQSLTVYIQLYTFQGFCFHNLFLFASPITIKVQGENFCKVQLGIFIEIALYKCQLLFLFIYFLLFCHLNLICKQN